MSIAQPKNNKLYWVKDNIIANEFPGINKALTEPDGLLAIGGDLSPSRLINAYSRGIFPWNNDNQPVLWWSPDPRWVIFPDRIHISRSLKKVLKQKKFRITFNKCFESVIRSCASMRENNEGTWITGTVIESFIQLHKLGFAHSVECWLDDELVGGLYGLALGRIFFGESMFSTASDASKTALVTLARILSTCNFELIDCQIHTRHLESMGATPIPREQFALILQRSCNPNIKLVLP